jgi:hypothetical protein
VGDAEVDVTSECPSGNATVMIETTFLDGLIINSLTSPFWYPSTVSVYCDGGSASTVELSSEQKRALLRSDAFLDSVAELIPERLEDAEEARRIANEY